MQLSTPSPRIIMLGGHESKKEMTFTIHCHDPTFKEVIASSGDSDAEGETLFYVEGSTFGTSWSWRRHVFSGEKGSSNDNHIFDFRHNSLDIKNGWVIEAPAIKGEAKPRILCYLVHKKEFTSEHSAINATVRTEVGEDVMVVMRSKDTAAITSTISVDGVCFATIHKEEENDVVFRGTRDRSVWKARVAAGVDLSLVSSESFEPCFPLRQL